MVQSVPVYAHTLPLNATELLIVATKTFRLSEAEALAYLKKHDVEITRNKYYKILGTVSGQTRERLYEVCKNMKERHMDRIDDVDLLRKLLLEIISDDKTKTSDKLKAIHELRELEPWISAFDEAAQGVLEDFVKQFGKEEHIDISNLFKEK